MQHRVRVPGSWLTATLPLVTACSTPTTTQEAAPEPVPGSEAGDQAGGAAELESS